MKKKSKEVYLYLLYVKDFCLILQLFMLPLIYFFFRTSYGYAQGLSFISSIWFFIFIVILTIYLLTWLAIYQIEKNYPCAKILNELKMSRYTSTVLAGYIFNLSLLNLFIFVTFTIISLLMYQNTLAIYKMNLYLIIIHIEIFVLTLYLLLRLNNIGHDHHMPLIDLFQHESIAEHKVIKKPLW